MGRVKEEGEGGGGERTFADMVLLPSRSWRAACAVVDQGFRGAACVLVVPETKSCSPQKSAKKKKKKEKKGRTWLAGQSGGSR